MKVGDWVITRDGIGIIREFGLGHTIVDLVDNSGVTLQTGVPYRSGLTPFAAGDIAATIIAPRRPNRSQPTVDRKER